MSASVIRAVLRSGRILTRTHAARTTSIGSALQVRMASAATPVSRKTLKQMNAADSNSSGAAPLAFESLAMRFFDEVEQAVESMKEKNKGFTVTRGEGTLDIDLGDGKGTYMFRTDNEVSTITLQSPMSGAQQYRYDTETTQWVSTSDDHDVRGLLTRDLIRQCVGYPEFP